MSVIRTPDQRLRVFVSSTLAELAAERAAVRAAIERLHLTPVMFELGARPHPPRELYRAYLEQSEVFVGIYWQRYGWIAPGEDVSGLEDEYRLAGDRPRLIYLKQPAADQESRLTAMLRELQSSGRASYKPFTTPEELAALVEDDLALLLSERFDRDRGDAALDAAQGVPPRPLTTTFGREHDIDTVTELLQDARLVTLTGPGGIGKTRLAIEVANRLTKRFPDGVWFVPLAAVTDAARALHSIATRVGTRVEAAQPADAVVAHLRDRFLLLVLDNIEQIEALGVAVIDLLARTSAMRVLATSRRALRVGGEREYALAPLPVPEPGPAAMTDPATQLFLDRARAADHRFVLGAADIDAVTEIVRRLDGIPLAIELAAARSRILPPRFLLQRLDSGLDISSAGRDDLPARQRTLRATLDWSFDLLAQSERAHFARLGVFAGGFTLEAAEAVIAETDVLDGLATLIDTSLIATDGGTPQGQPRFHMLETISAYARAQLTARDETDEYERRHFAWYESLANRAQPHLCGPLQREWVERMDPERPNLRAAVDGALRRGDHVRVIELTWHVIVLYFVRDAVDEPDGWLRRVAEAEVALDDVADAKLRTLLVLTRIYHGDYRGASDVLERALRVFRAEHMEFEAAVALHQLGFVRFRDDNDPWGAVSALEESAASFARIDHDWGVGLAEAMLASVFAAIGDLPRAEASGQRALDRARFIDSDQQTVQALGQLALVRLLEEQYEEAFRLVVESARTLRHARYRVDTANALDVLAVVLHRQGKNESAAMATAVASADRSRLHIEPWPTNQRFIDRVRQWVRESVSEARLCDIEARAEKRDPFDALAEGLAIATT